ncbi:hypothetical protein AcetOrient_orf03460 [Acetobacter orientalis]|uniref:Uncharacterized protein n=1 Tax=Acetobacter orientalis TaxID=146474 RepID=A0A2Z5ZKU3_9PROT|nr:hypothetical protein AcetOrient_orf03460 [Acetobacter orientalis]
MGLLLLFCVVSCDVSMKLINRGVVMKIAFFCHDHATKLYFYKIEIF